MIKKTKINTIVLEAGKRHSKKKKFYEGINRGINETLIKSYCLSFEIQLYSIMIDRKSTLFEFAVTVMSHELDGSRSDNLHLFDREIIEHYLDSKKTVSVTTDGINFDKVSFEILEKLVFSNLSKMELVYLFSSLACPLLKNYECDFPGHIKEQQVINEILRFSQKFPVNFWTLKNRFTPPPPAVTGSRGTPGGMTAGKREEP